MNIKRLSAFNYFKWSARQWCLFLPFAGALILVLLFYGLSDLTVDNWTLWLTGLVLLLYTVETQGLRFEMIRQNEMFAEPVIIANFKAQQTQKTALTSIDTMVLKNIGHGPALYVKVDDAILTRELGGNWAVSTVGMIDFIEAGHEVVITPMAPKTEQQTPDINAPRISKALREGDPPVILKIQYEDIGGVKRESVIRMDHKRFKLIRHGKVG
jgi:hypothetical protein